MIGHPYAFVMNHPSYPSLLVTAFAMLGACDPSDSDSDSDSEPIAPELEAMKADALDLTGSLEFDVPAEGEFVHDLQFDWYSLLVEGPSTVTLEALDEGAESVDTSLFLLGSEDGGSLKILARNYDLGPGRAVLDELELTTAGEYFAVVGTPYGDGRGRYSIVARCVEGACREPRAVAVTAGRDHACALLDDGRALCWGDDSHNQLQAPSTRFVQLDAGRYHTCGRTAGGELECWGENGAGQSSPPEAVGYVDVAAGNEHSCALTESGSIQCWGAMDGGQLDAPSDRTYVDVSAGMDAACAIDVQFQSVRCWGRSWDGQLDTRRAGRGVSLDMAPGGGASCLLNDAGRIGCWGGTIYKVRDAAPSGVGFRAIGVGASHACAVDHRSALVCWGTRHWGNIDHPPGIGYLAVTSGWSFSCAVDENGKVVCWGRDHVGQSSPPDALARL